MAQWLCEGCSFPTKFNSSKFCPNCGTFLKDISECLIASFPELDLTEQTSELIVFAEDI